jgi:F-type H+-transporting ATPase subunit epsilon
VSKFLHVKVVTPERTLFEEDVLEVLIPTVEGQITILPKHTRLVTKLIHGDMIIKTESATKVAAIYGGIAMVEADSKLTIIADSADHLHELDETEIAEAIKRAQDYKERFALEEAELAKSIGKDSHLVLAETQAEMLKNLTKLKVIRKHRSHRNLNIDK